MRYHNFSIDHYPLILEDFNGIQDYSLYLDLVEAELIGVTLCESVDQKSIKILEKLQTLAIKDAQIGNAYDYMFLMLDATGQLHILGNASQAVLEKITSNNYTFSNDKTYPDSRRRKLSYSQLYIFDNTVNFEKFKTYLRLKFDVLLESTKIYERQQQRTQIMYHGTSSALVPSILKNGLLARPPKKTYDTDTYGASTASMGGVYVADNVEFAKEIANDAIGTHGGYPALITLQYVKGSSDTDEDGIAASISDAAKKVMRTLAQKAPNRSSNIIPRDFERKFAKEKSPYDGMNYPDEGWAIDEMIANLDKASNSIATETIVILKKHSTPRQAAFDIIKQMAILLLKRASTYSDPRDRWNAVGFDAFDSIRENMEELLGKLMRQVSPDTRGEGANTRRIDRDVKFSGKTRILKIESPIGRVVYPKLDK